MQGQGARCCVWAGTYRSTLCQSDSGPPMRFALPSGAPHRACLEHRARCCGSCKRRWCPADHRAEEVASCVSDITYMPCSQARLAYCCQAGGTRVRLHKCVMHKCTTADDGHVHAQWGSCLMPGHQCPYPSASHRTQHRCHRCPAGSSRAVLRHGRALPAQRSAPVLHAT